MKLVPCMVCRRLVRAEEPCAFCRRTLARRMGLTAGVALSAALVVAACARETQAPVVIEPKPAPTATELPDDEPDAMALADGAPSASGGSVAPPPPRPTANPRPRRGEPRPKPTFDEPQPVPLYGGPPPPLEGEIV